MDTNYMEVEHLTETSLIIRHLREATWVAAEKFRTALPGIVDATSCYDSVGLYFDGPPPAIDAIRRCLKGKARTTKPKAHRIPICYQLGVDLSSAAQRLSMTDENLANLHQSRPYRCAAVGFSPGFAYLEELPEEIAGLPRLSSPRPRVEPGSLGITGRQTAVYPSATPGGWWLIGRCPLTLVAEEEDYFPIVAGDSVRFFAVEEAEFQRLKGGRL